MEALNDLLRRRVRLLGDKPFIITEDGVLTYRQLDEAAVRLAHVLRQHGIGFQDCVGLFLPSCPEFVIGYYACQKIGAIATSVSALYRFREVDGIVRQTDMTLILTGPATRAIAEEVRQQAPVLKHILTFGGSGDGGVTLEQQMAGMPTAIEDVFCGAEDLVSLFFTSGTTGLPKGTMQTNKCLVASLKTMSVYNQMSVGKEVHLCVLPLFNNFATVCILNGALFDGGSLVLIPRWDTEKVLHAIGRHRCTIMIGTPTMYIYMLRGYDPKRHDISSMRMCITGGSSVAPNMTEEFESTFKVPLLQIYGATESAGYVTGEPYPGIRKRGSAGVTLGACRVSVLDDEGNKVPAREIGEICIDGDVMVAGYWRDAEATRQSFTSKGWLSGDLGYMDEDGYLYIVDRKKDVIKSGGYNIFPLEVEDLLYSNPKIGVCAVVAMPDPDKGEIPVACIILKDGQTATEAEIIAFCRGQLAVYKSPRKVFFMDKFPLGPSGKILKRELRRQLTEPVT